MARSMVTEANSRARMRDFSLGPRRFNRFNHGDLNRMIGFRPQAFQRNHLIAISPAPWGGVLEWARMGHPTNPTYRPIHPITPAPDL